RRLLMRTISRGTRAATGYPPRARGSIRFITRSRLRLRADWSVRWNVVSPQCSMQTSSALSRHRCTGEICLRPAGCGIAGLARGGLDFRYWHEEVELQETTAPGRGRHSYCWWRWAESNLMFSYRETAMPHSPNCIRAPFHAPLCSRLATLPAL